MSRTEQAASFSCPVCNGYGGYAALECYVCEGTGAVSRAVVERIAASSGNSALSARVALRLASPPSRLPSP